MNFFFDEKSVQFMTFDLNQLQNEKWLTWFLVEFSNNLILERNRCEFLFLFLSFFFFFNYIIPFS